VCAEEQTFVIRAFRAGDELAASEILLEAREAAAWSATALRKACSSQGVHAFLSERKGKASGFIIGRQVADEAEILNLAVCAPYRRKGEGTALLERIVAQLKEAGVRRFFLEVRESNRGAIAFYEGLGFRPAGRREGYYEGPSEAALVLGRGTE
jgi:ribosomal-protein-alanine acetyltransferase